MTDPEAAALELLARELGAVPLLPWVRAKCPNCGRHELRDPYRLAHPCYLCTPVAGYGNYFGMLLAKEFGLSAKAYQVKLEKDGPPWVNPFAWVQPRSKWWKIAPQTGDQGGGVHHAS